MKNKPCWNSKAMAMHLAHTVSMIKNKSKKFFFASWLSSIKFTFFFQCLLQQVGVAPSWPCHALVRLAPNSWDPELSADAFFVSVLATVLSEYWTRLENFFQNDTIFTISSKWYHFKKIFPLAFFNILTEPLLVQKQMIHQQKAWDLSYLEQGHGCGMVKRVPRPLAAKDIEK